MQYFRLTLEQASTLAPKVDFLFFLMTFISFAVALGVSAVMVFFAIKYRYRPGVKQTSQSSSHLLLELVWSIIPAVIGIALFVWGAFIFYQAHDYPENALEINVVGKQWMWKIQHPNGKREVNSLHIPKCVPIKLNMTSQDVIHSFYIPAFRTKQDVLPARYTNQWFEATMTGEFAIFCAEYCGTNHSSMGGTCYVMEPDKYEEWLRGGPIVSPAAAGEKLFLDMGCVTCHDAGAGSRGPELKNLFGHEVELNGGEIITADDTYLMESILKPSEKIVKGFQPLMPSFQNQLTEDDVNHLITYIKSLSDAQ